ncbi:MAG: FAD binding domain-containing protein [Caldilineaceae bacterium]
MALLNEYHKPATLAEALQLLSRTETRLVPLAGGSRLIGELETRARRDVDGVVDLSGLGLSYIHAEDNELRVGAMTTISDLIAHPVAADLAGGLLRRVARYEGPINLRNAATLGGIVAAAEADSELYAALLALGASVVYGGGPHPQPLSQGTGRGETKGIAAPVSSTEKPTQAEPASRHDLAPLSRSDGRGVGGEGLWSEGLLLTEIRIPLRPLTSGHARIARTPMDRPIVAAVAVAGEDVERVVLCGVAARPILDDEAMAPVSDFKGSAEYRREMAGVVRQRALDEAKATLSG